jgi:hypothetical protein
VVAVVLVVVAVVLVVVSLPPDELPAVVEVSPPVPLVDVAPEPPVAPVPLVPMASASLVLAACSSLLSYTLQLQSIAASAKLRSKPRTAPSITTRYCRRFARVFKCKGRSTLLQSKPGWATAHEKLL